MQRQQTISAAFLVAGTCIGGGMLALPVATGVSGFLPSIAIMAICMLAMMTTALLLLEVNLWMEEGVHVITMASRILGPIGKVVSWFFYLFICYASIVAYTAGGGIQIASLFEIPKELGCVIFIFTFGAIIYLGSLVVGRVNAILFVGMIVAYFALVGMGLDEVKPQLLKYRNWSNSMIAIPLLLTSFSFQTMVPSLTPYLNRNAKALRLAVIGGVIITFIIYVVWQWLILGIVPVEGPNGLAYALASGDQPATHFLRDHVHGRWIYGIAEYFAFFAIVTSFLGIAFGLFDFLSDGLKIQKKGMGKVWLGALIVIPTLIFATQFERAFMVALDSTGGFGDSILNGIIPVLMVWIGRYKMGYQNHFRIPGGKPLLAAVFCFFVFALGVEILSQMGYITSIYEAYDVIEIHNIQEVKG